MCSQIMEEDKHSLLQPLIPPFSRSSSTITTTSFSSYSLHKHNDHDTGNNAKPFISDNSIVLRILLVLSVALISVWANYEASKTFYITIVNDAKDSPAGRRFALSYVSNDKATRIVLNTSSFVEHLLYPNNNNSYYNSKKHIGSVTLRLAPRKLNTTAVAAAAAGKSIDGYVIDISPVLLEDENFDKVAIVGAVQRAMARVWLWDGGSRAPHGLLDGMAEYVAELAGFRRASVSIGGRELPECQGGRGWLWEDKDPPHVARWLHYCENYKKGFIRRLNEAMRDTWHDRMVDDVLGMPATKLCGMYNASWLNLM